jgi:lipopolysaccharide exporter
MAASLGSRIAAGAAWMIVFKLLDRSIGIVSMVILARLLVPADFGLVTIATAIIAIIELLSAFNFDMALIQGPRRDGVAQLRWQVAGVTVDGTLEA